MRILRGVKRLKYFFKNNGNNDDSDVGNAEVACENFTIDIFLFFLTSFSP